MNPAIRQDVYKPVIEGRELYLKFTLDSQGQLLLISFMTRLLLLAAKHPDLFRKGTGAPFVSQSDAALVRETLRKSSVNRLYEQIYNSRPGPGHEPG